MWQTPHGQHCSSITHTVSCRCTVLPMADVAVTAVCVSKSGFSSSSVTSSSKVSYCAAAAGMFCATDILACIPFSDCHSVSCAWQPYPIQHLSSVSLHCVEAAETLLDGPPWLLLPQQASWCPSQYPPDCSCQQELPDYHAEFH